MQRRLEKSAYGRFKRQKQELDCVPGAWYRCQLALHAANSDRARHQSPLAPMKLFSDDELEYADDPAAAPSRGVSDRVRKRTRGDDEDGSSSDDYAGENSGPSHVARKHRKVEWHGQLEGSEGEEAENERD